jgi:hypothetical protein
MTALTKVYSNETQAQSNTQNNPLSNKLVWILTCLLPVRNFIYKTYNWQIKQYIFIAKQHSVV